MQPNYLNLNYEPQRDSDENSEHWASRVTGWALEESPDIQTALDLGMGKGHLVSTLRSREVKAIGVDVRNLGQQYLILADVRSLPFPNNFFDLVTEVYTLADMFEFQGMDGEALETARQEAHRVLKPGGLFITLPMPHIKGAYFREVLYLNNHLGHYKK